MLTYCFIITGKQCRQLLTSDPYHAVFQLNIKLDSIILILIYDNLILFHNYHALILLRCKIKQNFSISKRKGQKKAATASFVQFLLCFSYFIHQTSSI